MTRTRESKTISLLRRAARQDDDGSSMGVRLDRQARAVGYGTWSALLHATARVPSLDETSSDPWPFERSAAVNPTTGATIARVAGGRSIRLSPGHSMSCFSDNIGDLSRVIAVSAITTDDAGCYVVHGDGHLQQRTSRHRSTIGPAMILGDAGRHGCRIEPFSAPWLPGKSRYVPSHVRAIVQAMTGLEGLDAQAYHDIEDTALSLVSQSGDVAMQDVLRETAMRHHLPTWSNDDLTATMRGKAVTPKDLDGDRPITIYVPRGPVATSRKDRMARSVHSAIMRHRLGMDYVPRHHLVAVYDGPTTWEDQAEILNTPDLGRSKHTAQILVGGLRSDFERVQDPLNLVLHDSTTHVHLKGIEIEGEVGLKMIVHGQYAEGMVDAPAMGANHYQN